MLMTCVKSVLLEVEDCLLLRESLVGEDVGPRGHLRVRETVEVSLVVGEVHETVAWTTSSITVGTQMAGKGTCTASG